MSTELVPCPYCGDEPILTGAGAKVMCNNLKCPIYAREFSPCQWNRRFVRLDRNGKKVFNDSVIIGTMGDGSEHECFLQYKDYQWWATNTQATFGVTMSFKLCEFDQIELIGSDGE